MKTVIVLMLAAALLAGCCGIGNPLAPQPSQGGYTPGGETQPNQTADQNPPPQNDTQPQNQSGGNTYTPPEEPAGSQVDCATMTATCGACIAKPGCGWCKGSNSCFSGNSSGPAVSSCPSADWTTVESGCVAPAGGSACSKQTNCASCLSGTACKWCIQGSKCADASVQDSCLGGWLTVSYQCNYASR